MWVVMCLVFAMVGHPYFSHSSRTCVAVEKIYVSSLSSLFSPPLPSFLFKNVPCVCASIVLPRNTDPIAMQSTSPPFPSRHTKCRQHHITDKSLRSIHPCPKMHGPELTPESNEGTTTLTISSTTDPIEICFSTLCDA